MADKQGIPLTDISGFPLTATRRLADLWITTAEELVSAATPPDATRALAQYLGISEEDVLDLVDLADGALPEGLSFGLEDVEQYGLGALDEPHAEDPAMETFAVAHLPAHIDLHLRLPAVRNQGQRGTCVAHACVAVREFLLGKENLHVDLSEQFAYWSCKQRDGRPGSGSYLSVAMSCLEDTGVCLEQIWPYSDHTIAGNEGAGPPPAAAIEAAIPYRVEGSRELPARSLDDLRQALANEQPIAFAVPVYSYWFTDPVKRAGDIRLPLVSDHLLGGHAMCLLGYQDDLQVPGGGYFLVRNSWGMNWASRNTTAAGYCRIPYAYLQQYGAAAYTAWAAPTPAG
jgi:hypothetical protein